MSNILSFPKISSESVVIPFRGEAKVIDLKSRKSLSSPKNLISLQGDLINLLRQTTSNIDEDDDYKIPKNAPEEDEEDDDDFFLVI